MDKVRNVIDLMKSKISVVNQIIFMNFKFLSIPKYEIISKETWNMIDNILIDSYL